MPVFVVADVTETASGGGVVVVEELHTRLKAEQAMFALDDGNPQLLESVATCDWLPFTQEL